MQVAHIDTLVFADVSMLIQEAMNDPHKCHKLLNEATQDTPIIRDLLVFLGRLQHLNEKSPIAARVERDLVVLLTLRHMEREQASKAYRLN